MKRESDDPAEERGAEFVDKIVTDPNNVPDLMIIVGIPGKSSKDGYDRVYTDEALQNHVEVPTDDIVHRMPVPKAQNPFGFVVNWVKRGAALEYKMGPAARELASYFAGAIAGAASTGVQQPYAAFGPAAAAPQAVFPSAHFWKCTWYCGPATLIGIGGCASPVCTEDICYNQPRLRRRELARSLICGMQRVTAAFVVIVVAPSRPASAQTS
jgi:hypothetical protein